MTGHFPTGQVPILELVNDKCNALVHQVVEIGRDTCHFCHHANLKPKKRLSIIVFNPHNKKTVLYSPTSGDLCGGGSGDSGHFEVRANELSLGSSVDLRLGVVGTP